MWRAVLAIVAFAFAAALFVNPPHGFSIEDNLAYRDYILLHQQAENFVEARYPHARVLTAWPANDELVRPYLGYVTRPMQVLRIEDFTVEQLMAASSLESSFDIAMVFSTKYEPPHPWFERWRQWEEWKTEFFGYHRDVPPAAVAQLLGGRLVYNDARKGQWIGVIEMEPVVEALMPNLGSVIPSAAKSSARPTNNCHPERSKIVRSPFQTLSSRAQQDRPLADDLAESRDPVSARTRQ